MTVRPEISLAIAQQLAITGLMSRAQEHVEIVRKELVGLRCTSKTRLTGTYLITSVHLYEGRLQVRGTNTKPLDRANRSRSTASAPCSTSF